MKQVHLILLLVCAAITSSAQNRLAINDKTGLISNEVKSSLEGKLLKKSLIYSNNVNFDEMCKHKFATLSKSGTEYVLDLKDCNDQHAPMRNLGSTLSDAEPDEIATILAYNLSEMYFGSFSSSTAPPPLPADEPIATNERSKQIPVTTDSVYEHDTRYFFAPSSFNLKKGDLYYQTIGFFSHDVQYGVTDDFSVGMGTTIATIPFYITPKYSFNINEKNNVSVGSMLILGTWGIRAWGNLAYATYTYGTRERNVTFGAAHLYAESDPEWGDGFRSFSKPVGNISAAAKVSDHIHFLTENYFIPARYTYNLWNTQGFNRDVEVNNNVILGFTGFRLVNKKKDVISWQLGLFYLIQNIEELPAEFRTPDWNGGWRPDFPRLVLPALSYTQKFGKKY